MILTDKEGKPLDIYKRDYLTGYEFSIFMQNKLVSKDGYVIDTGNWENANAEIARLLDERVRKHPLIWKLFFMVA